MEKNSLKVKPIHLFMATDFFCADTFASNYQDNLDSVVTALYESTFADTPDELISFLETSKSFDDLISDNNTPEEQYTSILKFIDAEKLITFTASFDFHAVGFVIHKTSSATSATTATSATSATTATSATSATTATTAYNVYVLNTGKGSKYHSQYKKGNLSLVDGIVRLNTDKASFMRFLYTYVSNKNSLTLESLYNVCIPLLISTALDTSDVYLNNDLLSDKTIVAKQYQGNCALMAIKLAISTYYIINETQSAGTVWAAIQLEVLNDFFRQFLAFAKHNEITNEYLHMYYFIKDCYCYKLKSEFICLRNSATGDTGATGNLTSCDNVYWALDLISQIESHLPLKLTPQRIEEQLVTFKALPGYTPTRDTVRKIEDGGKILNHSYLIRLLSDTSKKIVRDYHHNYREYEFFAGGVLDDCFSLIAPTATMK